MSPVSSMDAEAISPQQGIQDKIGILILRTCITACIDIIEVVLVLRGFPETISCDDD